MLVDLPEDLRAVTAEVSRTEARSCLASAGGLGEPLPPRLLWRHRPESPAARVCRRAACGKRGRRAHTAGPGGRRPCAVVTRLRYAPG